MATTWSIWKDIGYPGEIVLPGEKAGDPERHCRLTSNDFAQLASTGKKKVKAGWNIPVCWEHQPVEPSRLQLSQIKEERKLAKAIEDREYAKSIFAHIKNFARTPNGGAKALLCGDDPADLKQLEKVKFVSPEIAWDWEDSTGRVWHGPTVTHLAATARPVQPHQHPIGTDPDRPHPRQLASLRDAIRMSFTGHGSVSHRLRLSLSSYVRLPRGNESLNKKALMKIAAALQEHCGLDLGDVKDVKDPEMFATLVDCAARNRGPMKKRKKRKSNAPVQLSHRANGHRSGMTENQVVSAFFKMGDGDEDDTVSTFLKMVFTS